MTVARSHVERTHGEGNNSMSSHDFTEAIERAAYADLFAACSDGFSIEHGLEANDIDGALVMSARASDNPMFNRAIGASASSEQLRKIAWHFADRGIGRYFIHLDSAARSPALDGELVRLGLARYPRSWVKLVRDAAPLVPVERRAGDPPVDVREAASSEALEAARIYCAAFDQPDALAPFIANVHGRDGWHMLVGREAGEVVAVGLSFRRADVLYLVGAATRPSHRRRGYQSAMLQARVRRAMDFGCRHIVAETGEAQVGDPQHSFRNMIRHGFEQVAVRDNYAPRGVVWRHGRPGPEAA
jgi:GNAT superfamily N-acetyltransferase